MQKFARAAQMAERYGVNPSTWWDWVKKEIVPPPLRISQNASLFDIEACEKALIEHSDSGTKPKIRRATKASLEKRIAEREQAA